MREWSPASRCVICRTGEMTEGRTTLTLQRGETTVVIKDLPAELCDNCAEPCLSEAMTEQMLALAEAAVAKSAEVKILRRAA